jgi:hypothetical protein
MGGLCVNRWLRANLRPPPFGFHLIELTVPDGPFQKIS